MRLKSLQIKGFKSFANDTVLNFEHDVIGIVGPNGSGKSNIVDAMRWVLGEQKNKDLRLEHMKDIIFNGTANRKKAYKAEVSVTFDNTKSILPTTFNTIKITRRLFQTGESEYALNDIRCRLKDIQNLFMDSGIGSNSYAIIELGMVDDILQDKDNARRRMFEQAAGISKYKKHKKESLQKLLLTDDDLERLEDLLIEIKSNLDQLRKQAKKAAKYKVILEERRDKLLTYKKLELNQILSKRSANEHLLEKTLDSYNYRSSELRLLEAKVEGLKKDHVAQERKLSDSQKKLRKLIDEIASYESDRKLNEQQIIFSKEHIIRLQQEVEAYIPKLELLRATLMTLKEDIIKVEKVLKQEESELSTIEEGYELIHVKLESQNKELELKNHHRQKVNNIKIDLEKELVSLQSKIEHSKESLVSLNYRSEELGLQMNKCIQRRKELEITQKELKIELENLSAEEINQSTAEASYIKAIESKGKDTTLLLRKLDAANNEKALLSSLIESMEGYPAANKFVLQKLDSELPILSEIIHIKEEYRVAIESYLEPYLNFFIAVNQNHALDIISQLANSQKGRVSFFILDKFKELTPKEDFNKGTKVLDFVSCDPIFSPLINKLLENVYLTSQASISDKTLFFEIDKDIIFISDGGDYIIGGDFISGGSVGLFEGKRTGRKQQLEKIGNDITKYKQRIAKANEEVHELKVKLSALSLKSIKKRKQQKSDEVRDLKYQFDLNDHDIDSINIENESIQEKSRAVETELQRIKALTDQKNRTLEECLNNLIEIEREIGEEVHLKDRLAKKYSILSQKLNQKKLTVIQHENDLQNLLISKEHHQQSHTELNRKLSQARKELLLSEDKKKAANIQLHICEEQLAGKYEEKESFSKELNVFEQVYFDARGEIHIWEEEHKKMTKLQNQDQTLVNQHKEVLVSLRFEREKIEERVRVEFKEDVHNWNIPDHLMELDMHDLGIEIERLDRKMLGFTEVNPLALEAYQELELRFENIVAQRNDILSAKEDLIKTIKEIENKATDLFLDAFEEIRKYFVHVFRSLFTNDDDCDLILKDPSNPLNSEIEILAKPKGKRPKSLSQLSGGEKALTATALLFALYLLKPAPFCIFDEVDAPLDDNNVQKFGNIIRTFSKDSQFLMITHNKLTMAEVDILYGIFMQEKGVSQVAPVDLTMLGHDSRIGEFIK